ncbi:MAG TPA: 1-acyl-sn-glycerol-3-phosphate acyltransferase [Candidatus Onthomorpha intestinigallinarum]|uniref:1-acyl-sn-glycerol-3-phosphate acyltransferase n=1 Tax=Candidatus Onthomorpha intestinigallinarum TaxID=2840880 RepID=A0A9D1RH50_9BACT|nr:1-acyl-sn-glycerol-3-phosphate acyltransferase [Candidatus Onthomorpha intestinigallinarum]
MNEGFSSGNIRESEKFIDLEKLIASKNKRLLRLIPQFAMNWFKKLVHIDQINALLYKYRDTKGVDFAKCIVEKELGVKIVVNNPENIPVNSRALVVANHPIGSIDGMALMIAVGRTRNDILFPVNDMLCALPPFKGIFVPINKYGRNSSNHDILNEAFHSDSCVMFFPAGTESKYIDGVFQDFSWKKTFVKKAVEFGRDVTPVYIDGINSKRFYRLSAIRRFFGIKFDLEMILLPDEMFKYKNKTITLTFGTPISYREFGSDRTALEWANIVREHVYKLKNDVNVKFEPNVKR